VSSSGYRSVLRNPAVVWLLVLGALTRLPLAAINVGITLHVVNSLGRGYGAAGIAAAAYTVGVALGGPWRGRRVDQLGVRRALVPSVILSFLLWSLVPWLSYPALVATVVVNGIFSVPVPGIMRQCITVAVSSRQRRAALSLDSMAVEIAFMVGPAAVVVAGLWTSASAALTTAGMLVAVSGLVLMIRNPPTRSDGVPADPGWARRPSDMIIDTPAGPIADAPAPPAPPAAPAEPHDPGRLPDRWCRVARDRWPYLNRPLLGVFGATCVGAFLLGGSEVSIVAVLREGDRLGYTAPVLTLWSVISLLGAVVYGGTRRPPRSTTLLLGMGILTIPIGLVPDTRFLLLTVLPSGALCAPLITSTVEGIGRHTPEAVRGEAMGWHASALTVGMALGTPLAGKVIDESAPWCGFVVIGTVCVLLALLLRAAEGVSPRPLLIENSPSC
jgi:MFS family permease